MCLINVVFPVWSPTYRLNDSCYYRAFCYNNQQAVAHVCVYILLVLSIFELYLVKITRV